MSFQVTPIWMWKGSGNNYAYLLTCEKTRASAIVDPAEPTAVLPVLQKKADSKEIDLQYVLTTHHHSDHAGGNGAVSSIFPSAKVFGGKYAQAVTYTPKNKETFKVGEVEVQALHTPCHTQDSICYYVSTPSKRGVFTGDTLFTAGCGRFFEGDASEMHHALNTVLASLPDDTITYPGHEYTKSNAKFASSVLSNPELTKLVDYCSKNESTTGKFTLGEEKQFNPFMHLDAPDVQKAVKSTNPISIMNTLRTMKNKS
ncbi:glyoxalase II [Schizosaccharomyces osmophilus]|uniref:hydroxyacylglutathione hydrolase n=1 Tax=Schizosaccharomyces osmophilus TaxID=2545709 RepID=A0AAF0AU65_9SCHI|nr:glyoxalase II [Schizosaccharomyces osmophilus]WBW72136.1 glyoxalase II [Schizosaccharomyces osmophilus]